MNFDDAMFDDIDEAGIGVVIRNAHGEVVASLAEKIQKPTSVIAWSCWQPDELPFLLRKLVFTMLCLRVILSLSTTP